MSDIALTLPTDRSFPRRETNRSRAAAAQSASVYAAFALSVAFSFALVFGVVH